MDKELLKIIADNPSLFDTLKKHLIDKFDIPPQTSDLGVEDIVLGQILRARLVGIKKIEEAFNEILNYQSVKAEGEKVNLAR